MSGRIVTPASRPARIFGFNLLALLLAGVLLSFWMLYFTEAFPVVGGLLGLTGLFAWIGFLANMLTSERKSALQNWFDQRVLQSNFPWIVSVLVLVVFGFLVVARTGTLVIDASGDEMARSVSVWPVATASGPDVAGHRLNLAARSRTQQLLPTGWFRPVKYRVRAAGLPDVHVEVRPAQRVEIALPDAGLSAPVVLVRPGPTLSAGALSGDYRLTVTRNGQPLAELDEYRGSTVWIGARRDVVIPQRLIDRWRTDLIERLRGESAGAGAVDAVISRWRWPMELPSVPELSFGDRLEVSILDRSEPDRHHSACRNVVLPASRADFPQELVIDVDARC